MLESIPILTIIRFLSFMNYINERLMKETQVTVELSEKKLVNIIRLRGEVLESNNGEEIYEKINLSIQQKIDVIVLDLSELKYIGNGGRKIIEDCRKLAKEGKIDFFVNRPH